GMAHQAAEQVGDAVADPSLLIGVALLHTGVLPLGDRVACGVELIPTHDGRIVAGDGIALALAVAVTRLELADGSPVGEDEMHVGGPPDARTVGHVIRLAVMPFVILDPPGERRHALLRQLLDDGGLAIASRRHLEYPLDDYG